ncbi:APHP domain-containing protein, partial [Streptomyces cavourensis]
DLGTPARVDEVTLKLPPTWESRTQTLSLQGSADGTSFATLKSSAAYSFTPGAANTVKVTFAATLTRFVRVHITANTGWQAAQLSELEVRAAAASSGNLAAGKTLKASSSTGSYTAANANDGQVNTYWESNGHPATLTVKLGADADLHSVVVKLNPDPVWATRTQEFQVLGRTQSGTGFTSLKARAGHVFNPATNANTVTVPVSGRAADVQLQFFSNTEAPGAQVAEIQ